MSALYRREIRVSPQTAIEVTETKGWRGRFLTLAVKGGSQTLIADLTIEEAHYVSGALLDGVAALLQHGGLENLARPLSEGGAA